MSNLGDVKFSVLSPDMFIKINGDAWVPLDGGKWMKDKKKDFKRTDLYKKTRKDFSKIDARGVFIRGMNMGQGGQKGDPDSRRGVGAYQKDSIITHHHSTPFHSAGSVASDDTRINYPNVEFFTPENHRYGESRMTTTLIHDNSRKNHLDTKEETRPRNICLYVYIKVKDAIDDTTDTKIQMKLDKIDAIERRLKEVENELDEING